MLYRLLFFLFFNHYLLGLESVQPVKALWVVRDFLTQQHLIDEVLEFANKNGFNHIFAQVRGRGDAYYNSEIVPKSHLVKTEFDPLNHLIDSNNNNDIMIHAWINVYYLWSSMKSPTQKNHILLNNPEWLDRKKGDHYIKEKIYLQNIKTIL